MADKEADCFLISNYYYNKLAKQIEKLNLTALATGEILDYYIAVVEGNTELYSILTRTTNIVSKANINAALSYYSAEEAKPTLIDFIHRGVCINYCYAASNHSSQKRSRKKQS